mmetsp:Transcript_4948/g.10741  ORF Transcript_4948/g.10741 Transcript_4948/m.10741 type:complete len:98 (-) Transcript_4948:8-301(-)
MEKEKKLQEKVYKMEQDAIVLLRTTKKNTAQAMATCERRSQAADAAIDAAKQKMDNDTTSLYASEARFRKSQEARAGETQALRRSTTGKVKTKFGQG